MVFAELEEMAEDWDRSGDFWDSVDVRDVCSVEELKLSN